MRRPLKKLLKRSDLVDLKTLMELFETHYKIAITTTQNTPIQKAQLAFMMIQAKQNELIIEELKKLNNQ